MADLSLDIQHEIEEEIRNKIQEKISSKKIAFLRAKVASNQDLTSGNIQEFQQPKFMESKKIRKSKNTDNQAMLLKNFSSLGSIESDDTFSPERLAAFCPQ